jgi:RNA polymerase sigma-70 factor (ECF subfamily)
MIMFIRRNNKTSLADKDLLDKYQETGDQEVLSTLYERYLELVYGLCLKYLKDEASGKDAVMEIFVVLVSKLKSHPVDQFKSWLYVVVKNHCLQILRKQKQHLKVIGPADDMYSDDFLHHDIAFDFVDDHADLYSCLKDLPDGQRSSIEWFYLEKKSYEEIAVKLNVSRDQVRSFIQNGRRNLKNCMLKKSNGTL